MLDRTIAPLSVDGNDDLDSIVSIITAAHDGSLSASAGLNLTPRRSIDGINAVCYTVFVSREYESAEDQIVDLMVRIATGHCYPDGNKRTALVAGLTLMEYQGLSTGGYTVDDLVSVALSAASGSVDEVRKILFH
jgi:prophage maintenance system killer protein